MSMWQIINAVIERCVVASNGGLSSLHTGCDQAFLQGHISARPKFCSRHVHINWRTLKSVEMCVLT